MDFVRLIIRLITSFVVYIMVGIVINFGYNLAIACMDLYNKSTGELGVGIFNQFKMDFTGILSFEPSNVIYYLIGFVLLSKFLILEPILDFIQALREKAHNDGKRVPKFKGQSKSGVNVNMNENYKKPSKLPSDILKEQTRKELGEGVYAKKEEVEIPVKKSTLKDKLFSKIKKENPTPEVLNPQVEDKPTESIQEKPKNSNELYEENYEDNFDELNFGDVFVNDLPDTNSYESITTNDNDKYKLENNDTFSESVITKEDEIDDDELGFTMLSNPDYVETKSTTYKEETVIPTKNEKPVVEPIQLNSENNLDYIDDVFSFDEDEEIPPKKDKERKIIPVTDEDYENNLYTFSLDEIENAKRNPKI